GEVLSKLEANLPEIRERFFVQTIGIFGSVSRGEDRPDSDVDVLVTWVPGMARMNIMMGLIWYLEELFSRKIDLVSTDGISPYLKPYVMPDVIWC
ncbi:MAG: nucleotidyltransferase family protein, partial [Methanocorpusculum sp.]|nr:nucleotidyltransferase family protein [Methanocorpusculum sp.]